MEIVSQDVRATETGRRFQVKSTSHEKERLRYLRLVLSCIQPSTYPPKWMITPALTVYCQMIEVSG